MAKGQNKKPAKRYFHRGSIVILNLYQTVSRTSCIYFVTLEYTILFFLRKPRCASLIKRGWISALHKRLCKGRLEKRPCLGKNFRYKLTFSSTIEAIDSAATLWPKIRRICFTSYYLITIPLYTMLKSLAFLSLCLVPNKIDFVLSWLKCILIYYRQTSYTNLKDL